jgi:TolB-like protein/Flp pilus assembly protein TadD
MSLLSELNRRNVFRVAAAYVVLSWVVLQVADVLFEALLLPDVWNRAVLGLLVLGFIPALVFAWVYEMTPEGLKKESEILREESVTAHTARKLNLAVVVLLAIAVGLYAAGRFPAPTAERPSGPQASAVETAAQIDSIAVLPFEDFSAGRDQVHLAEGLADTLLHMLAQVPQLKVAARTSSFSFRGTSADIAEIGRELGVGAVLEGSVQRSGDTLRIIAQLIRVSDQSHLWSQTFDRPTGDIFAVQDEIANAVVAALRPGAEDAAESALASDRTSVEAYEHFVRGDRLWQVRSKEAIDEAIVEFKAAIAIDPDYAPAHAGLAIAYLFTTIYGDRTFNEVRLVVEQEIAQALALDPELGLAYAVKGGLMERLNDPEGAEAGYRRAIELDPSNAAVHTWLAGLLRNDFDRWDEADALIERAYELDPRNVFVLGVYGGFLAGRGNYDRAVEVARRAVALEPEAPRPYSSLAALHGQFGRYDDAIRARLAQIERSPESPQPYVAIAGSFLALDDQEAAQKWFDKAREFNPNQEYWPYWFLREADHDRLVAEMEQDFARDPEDPGSQRAVCEAYLVVGRHQDVMDTCRPGLEPFLGGQIAALDLSLIGHALPVAWSARQLGDTATADRLEEELLRMAGQAGSRGVVDSGYYWFVASLDARTGNRDGMLTHLRKAVDAGATDIRWLEVMPWWDPYRDDPEFLEIQGEIKARQLKMRNSLRAEGL